MKIIWLALRSLWNLLLHACGWAIPLLVVLLATNLSIALLRPAEWEFSIDAVADAVEISVPMTPETPLRVDGAVFCQRGRGPASGSICGSRRWQALDLRQVAEPVLVLGRPGGEGDVGRVRLTVETGPSDGVHASLRTDSDGEPIGWLRAGDDVGEIELRSPLNIIWPHEPVADGIPREFVWPFVAEITVGRDVNWANANLTRSGQIIVYSASQDAISRRAQIAETELVLGDQVRLLVAKDSSDNHLIWPKGFLRFDHPASENADASIDIVAYGRAESILIERFGDRGYNFRPGWWARVINHNGVVLSFALLSGLLAFRGSYAESSATPVESWRELKKAWRRTAGDGSR